MNKGLLDSDMLSEIRKGVNPTINAHATTYRRSFGRYTFSTISVMEVVRGYQQTQSTRHLQAFLTSISAQEIVVFDLAAAELAGHIAGDLARVGQQIGVADPMIAALAIYHRLELVTGNTAHFQRIQLLGYPLVLQNWRI